MPKILRKVKKAFWIKHSFDWLESNSTQADSLNDLRTSDNTLSVWQVDDDKTNLERIIAALASNCDYISNFDYILLDMKEIERYGFSIENTEGNSSDDDLNDKYHIDIKELSARKIYELSELIYNSAEVCRLNKKKVAELIKESLNSKHIKKEKIKESIKEKLD